MDALMGRVQVCLLAAVLAGGCSRPSEPPPAAAPAPPAAPAQAVALVPPAIVSRRLSDEVWSVQASNAVAPGTLYVFLPDGTLLISSPGSRPGLGTWNKTGEGKLTMVEESRPYAVDVLELTAKVLRLRSHNPGTPVEMTLAPATLPVLVPERFQGEWNAKPRDCGTAGNESRLRIGADSIRFYEGAGSLRAVLPQPGNAELVLVTQLWSDGQARLAYRQYRVSADGRTLTDVTAGERGGLVRQRCAAR